MSGGCGPRPSHEGAGPLYDDCCGVPQNRLLRQRLLLLAVIGSLLVSTAASLPGLPPWVVIALVALSVLLEACQRHTPSTNQVAPSNDCSVRGTSCPTEPESFDLILVGASKAKAGLLL